VGDRWCGREGATPAPTGEGRERLFTFPVAWVATVWMVWWLTGGKTGSLPPWYGRRGGLLEGRQGHSPRDVVGVVAYFEAGVWWLFLRLVCGGIF